MRKAFRSPIGVRADIGALRRQCLPNCKALRVTGSLSAPPSVPLELLSTDASHRYARLMREAFEAARAVDHERGYGSDGPADMLEGLAEEAEFDAYGAVGVVQE